MYRVMAGVRSIRTSRGQHSAMMSGGGFGSLSAGLNLNVNVNPVCPIGQPVSGTVENCETTPYIHQGLQNSKNSGRFERQNSTSIAEISHEGKFM